MSVPGNIFDTLVTDRTESDVDRLLYLASLWVIDEETGAAVWAGTEAELEEWNSPLKGAYNAEDMNRVGEAVSYLGDLLTACGIYAPVQPVTTWLPRDIPPQADIAMYLENIRIVRSALTVYETTPPVPVAGVYGFTCQEANDIERILADVYAQIQIMKKTPCTCGASVCGGDYL